MRLRHHLRLLGGRLLGGEGGRLACVFGGQFRRGGGAFIRDSVQRLS